MQIYVGPGHLAQSVASLIVDPGVMSLILAPSPTFMENDSDIFSKVILISPIQEGLVSVTSESMCMKNWLTA